jgi:hypothetical protein
MTEAEQIEHIQEVERLTEEYLRGLFDGYDIDMSEMSTQELEQFFLNLRPTEIDGLRTYLAMQLTGAPPEADVLDFGVEMATPLQVGGVPILFTGMLKPFLSGVKVAGKVAAAIPGMRWLGRAVGVLDDAGDFVNAVRPIAVNPAVAAAERANRAGRLFGGPVSGAGRTTAAAGQAIPKISDDLLRAEQLRIAEGVAGLGAAGAVTYEVGQQLGELQHPQSEYTGPVDPGREKTQDEKSQEDLERRQTLAAETESTDVTSIINNQAGVMKQIYFEGLSETAAFDKVTNWLAGSGINVLAESGVSLGAAIEMNELSAGFGGTMGEMQVYMLTDEKARDDVRKYLKANWQRIDVLKDDPALAAISQQAAGTISGPMAPEEVAVDAAVEQFLGRMVRNADTLLLASEDPAGTGKAVGFVTSFDGTPNGNVVSLNDMFSGGKIGYMNLLPMLQRARPEQITFWQQQLYAWGYLEKPPEVWGEITPDANGEMHTLDAAHRWQVAVVNEGVKMVRTAQRGAAPGTPYPLLSELIAPDGTPRADRVLDRAIAARMSGDTTKATDARTMRDRVVTQAQDRVSAYLEATGRYLPEGSAMQIQMGLDQALSGVSAEDQESAFGQGGTPYERALAENVLRRLAEANGATGDWKDMLTFGTTNRDSSFFDYAARAGAVSERERALLEAGAVGRNDYRRHWKGREEDLKGVEADVAVASLLKFISQGMTGDFSTVTSSDIARGVNVYMNTVGIQQGLNNPMGENDLTMLAQGALSDSRNARFQQDNQMITDVATGGVDQMGLRGGVSGYQFRDLVNQLDSIQGARKMSVPNV